MRLAKIHWAALLPGLAPGEYKLRSGQFDAKGIAHPCRARSKIRHAAIESVEITVKGLMIVIHGLLDLLDCWNDGSSPFPPSSLVNPERQQE